MIAPVKVSSHNRVSTRGFSHALPLALSNKRLFSLFATCLVDLELWSDGKLTDDGLRFLCSVGGPYIRRLVLRACWRLSTSALEHVMTHCQALRALDLSLMENVTDSFLTALCSSGIGKTLQKLLVRRCASLTDTSIIAVADHCEKLAALDVAGLDNITDYSIVQLCAKRREFLCFLILSYCAQLTDASVNALADTKVQALFLRGLRISDHAVYRLAKDNGDHLITIDLLNCPNITNNAFMSLREHCPALSPCLRDLEVRSVFQNAVSILHGYLHIVAGVSQSGSRATFVCIVDAGSANAFAFQMLSGGEIAFEMSDVKILATNSGLSVTDETRRFVKESFGVDV